MVMYRDLVKEDIDKKNKKDPESVEIDAVASPFVEIDIQLLNDATDQSNIELDGIVLVSGNEFTINEHGEIEFGMQEKIHDTIKRIKEILTKHKNGQVDTVVRQLIDEYDNYIKLLSEELEETIIYAWTHGWKSSRHNAGAVARNKINSLKDQLKLTD